MARPSSVYVSSAPQHGNAALMWRMDGMSELLKLLEQLPKEMRRTPLVNALKTAAEPTRALAEAKAPDSGEQHEEKLKNTIVISTKLKASQRVRRGYRARRDVVEIYVGSTSSVAHLVEFGTKERRRTGATAAFWAKKGVGSAQRHMVRYAGGSKTVGIGMKRPGYLGSTGRIQGVAFMTQAWDATKHDAKEILEAEMWEQVKKAVRRLAGRAQRGTLSVRAMRQMQKMRPYQGTPSTPWVVGKGD